MSRQHPRPGAAGQGEGDRPQLAEQSCLELCQELELRPRQQLPQLWELLMQQLCRCPLRPSELPPAVQSNTVDNIMIAGKHAHGGGGLEDLRLMQGPGPFQTARCSQCHPPPVCTGKG